MNVKNRKMTFDQLQRYRLTGEVIDYLRGKKPLLILDAGSREGFLKNYLPEDRIINLDCEFLGREDFVQGDVHSLPLGDQAVDFAVALDILEHVPPEGRLDFLNELRRVSSQGFVLAAPFAEEKVEEAERLVNEFCLKVTGEENAFLVEHLTEGLPHLKEVLKWAEKEGYQTMVIPNAYLYRWVMMMCLNSYLSQLAEPWDIIFAVNNFYHQRFYKLDNTSPGYRKFLVFSKKEDFCPGEVEKKFIVPSPLEIEPSAVVSFMKSLLEVIDSEKDDLLLTLKKDKAQLARKLSREIKKLSAIIDQKNQEKNNEVKKLTGEIEKLNQEKQELVSKLTGIIDEKQERLDSEINKLTGIINEKSEEVAKHKGGEDRLQAEGKLMRLELEKVRAKEKGIRLELEKVRAKEKGK